MSRAEDDKQETLDEFKDLTPRDIADGNPATIAMRKRLAAVLEDGLSFVRTSERSADYFSGYTLATVLRDRIVDIGEDVEETAFSDGAVSVNKKPSAPSNPDRIATIIRSSTGLTRIQELVLLRANVNATVDALLKVEPITPVQSNQDGG